MQNVAPMKEKTVLITGASDGIGKITALRLAEMGATIVGIGRNPEKCAIVANEIRSKTGNMQVDFLVADLSSQAAVHKLVREYESAYPRLDVLINNAGAFMIRRQKSLDGIEMTLALNHLGYFLLTNLLMDRLASSTPSRVVVVASGAHFDGRMRFDDLQFNHGYNGWSAYAQSKLANLLFAYELSRRTGDTGITVNALHPGFVASKFAQNNGSLIRLGMKLVTRFIAISPEQGARTNIYLASSPEVEGVSGKYFVDCVPRRSSPQSYDEAAAKRLWEISEKMVGL